MIRTARLLHAAGWLGVAAIAAFSLFGLEVRVRDLAALLFPAVASGLFAHGVRARTGASPAWLRPGYTARPSVAIGAAGIGICLVLFCRPAAWGFAGEIAGGEIEAFDLAGSLLLIAVHSGSALASAPRWLRDPALRHCGVAALFPLVVVPGLAIVHGAGSGRAAATWMCAYALVLAALLWRAGTQRDRPGLSTAARGLVLLSLAARFLEIPLW